jgi:hypothetical protein
MAIEEYTIYLVHTLELDNLVRDIVVKLVKRIVSMQVKLSNRGR